jgi:protein-disulfide isomerase
MKNRNNKQVTRFIYTSWLTRTVVLGLLIGHSAVAAARDSEPTLPKSENTRHFPSASDAPTLGNRQAIVTVVMFSDMECRFCEKLIPAVDRLRDEYKDNIRIVWKDFPLPFHKNAMSAAVAARAADNQGKFWDMTRLLFENSGDHQDDALLKFARKINLNEQLFLQARQDKSTAERVRRDIAEGKEMGVTGTPSLFINGIGVVGAVPYDDLKQVVEAALTEVRGLPFRGLTGDALYAALKAKFEK